MLTIGIFEAKNKLGQLAQAAASGEGVVLTRRGKPVAEIHAPRSEIAQTVTRQAIDGLLNFCASSRSGAFAISELVAEGRC